MAIVYADRVQEQTSTAGTGTLTLTGAIVGHRTFVAGVGNGNESYYSIVDDTTNEWEVGRGTVGASTLSRDTVIASSNANALVNFGAGTKTVSAVAASAFFQGALTTVDHASLDHTGITGVPAAESFTSAVHSATDHTGLPGINAFDATAHEGVDHTAAPFNLLDEPAHDALDHSGLPGVPAAEAFTAGVHAGTDHSGIPGVGGLIDSDEDQVNVSGALSVTIPANTLTAPGQSIKIVGFHATTMSGGSWSAPGFSVAPTFAQTGGGRYEWEIVYTAAGQGNWHYREVPLNNSAVQAAVLVDWTVPQTITLNFGTFGTACRIVLLAKVSR